MLHTQIEALRNKGSTEKRSLSHSSESTQVIKQQKLNSNEIIALLDEIDALECEPFDEPCQLIPNAQTRCEVLKPILESIPLQPKVFDDFDIGNFLQDSPENDNLYVPRFTASDNPQPRAVDMILTLPLEQPMHRHLFAPTLLSLNFTKIRSKYPLVPLCTLLREFPKDKRIIKSPEGLPFALMVQSQRVVFYDTLCTLTDTDVAIQATISRTVTEALESTTKLVFGTVLVLRNVSFINHGEWHMCVVRRNVVAVYHNTS